MKKNSISDRSRETWHNRLIGRKNTTIDLVREKHKITGLKAEKVTEQI
jgi:hypothetical protein